MRVKESYECVPRERFWSAMQWGLEADQASGAVAMDWVTTRRTLWAAGLFGEWNRGCVGDQGEVEGEGETTGGNDIEKRSL